MQALTVAGDSAAKRQHDDLVRAAFIGWQVAGSVGMAKVGSFDRYLRRLGIKTPGQQSTLTPRQIERERRRSQENTSRAREAFGRGAIRA